MSFNVEERLKDDLAIEDVYVKDGIIVQGIDENETNEAEVMTAKLVGKIETSEANLNNLDDTILGLESLVSTISQKITTSNPEVVHVVNASLLSLESRFNIPSGGLTVGLESDDNANSATAEQANKITSMLTALKDSAFSIISNIGGLIDKLIGNVAKHVSGIRDKALKAKKNVDNDNVGGKLIKLTNSATNVIYGKNGINGGDFINTFRETSDVFNAISNSHATEDGFKAFVDLLIESNSKGELTDKTIKSIGNLTRELDKKLVSSNVDGEFSYRNSREIFGVTKERLVARHISQVKPTRESINAGLMKLVQIYKDTEKEDHASSESFTISFEHRMVDFLAGGARTWLGGAILYYGLTIVIPKMATSFLGFSVGVASGSAVTLLIGGALVAVSYTAIIAIAVIIAKKLILSGSRQLVYSLENSSSQEVDSKLIDFLVEYSTEYQIVSGEKYKEAQPILSLNSNEVNLALDFIVRDCDSIISMCKSLKDRNKLIGSLKPVFKSLVGEKPEEKQILSLVEKNIKAKLKSHLNFEKDFLNSYSNVLSSSLEYALVSNGE